VDEGESFFKQLWHIPWHPTKPPGQRRPCIKRGEPRVRVSPSSRCHHFLLIGQACVRLGLRILRCGWSRTWQIERESVVEVTVVGEIDSNNKISSFRTISLISIRCNLSPILHKHHMGLCQVQCLRHGLVALSLLILNNLLLCSQIGG
jgi:hypothetical protein